MRQVERWVEKLEIPAQPEYTGAVRRRLVEIVCDAGYSFDEASEMAVAVGEAVANAIEHAKPAIEPGVVNVTMEVTPSKVEVVVKDHGIAHWDPSPRLQEPQPETALASTSPRGRGICYMRLLMDSVQVNVSDDGTEVHLVKYRKNPGRDD